MCTDNSPVSEDRNSGNDSEAVTGMSENNFKTYGKEYKAKMKYLLIKIFYQSAVILILNLRLFLPENTTVENIFNFLMPIFFLEFITLLNCFIFLNEHKNNFNLKKIFKKNLDPAIFFEIRKTKDYKTYLLIMDLMIFILSVLNKRFEIFALYWLDELLIGANIAIMGKIKGNNFDLKKYKQELIKVTKNDLC